MAQLIEFFGNHLALVAAFLAILGMLVFTSMQASGIEKVSPADSIRLINHENALILDVRTDAEFSEGHMTDALHVPQSSLSGQLGKLEKHKQRPIILVCRTGQRSVGAGNTLRKNGFKKVYNLRGGVLAWQEANLPLTRK